jgi:hypothetical protein
MGVCKCIRTYIQSGKTCFRYCGINDPSWAELYHFVNFLNVQLRDCEESVFCDPELAGDLLQGFRTFAVRFMIQMSRVSFSFNKNNSNNNSSNNRNHQNN